jgi:hypothetical protein
MLAVAAVGIAAVLAAGGLGGHASLSGDAGHLPAAAAAPAKRGPASRSGRCRSRRRPVTGPGAGAARPGRCPPTTRHQMTVPGS